MHDKNQINNPPIQKEPRGIGSHDLPRASRVFAGKQQDDQGAEEDLANHAMEAHYDSVALVNNIGFMGREH